MGVVRSSIETRWESLPVKAAIGALSDVFGRVLIDLSNEYEYKNWLRFIEEALAQSDGRSISLPYCELCNVLRLFRNVCRYAMASTASYISNELDRSVTIVCRSPAKANPIADAFESVKDQDRWRD